jgi:CHAT domain-containing protein/lipopolysaccharide biosynthesis regulator YciM
MVRRSFRFWQTLFIISLVISLLLGQVSHLKAQAPNSDMLVQQGVSEYQQGQYQKAIALWQQALTSYQATADNPNTVIVLENLARAYQQIGQAEQAIAFWSQVTEQYQNQGNKQQLGRSLTEQAQAYSRLGQHRQAITLLCASRGEWHSPNKQDLHNKSITINSEAKNECQTGSAIAIAQEQQDQLGETAALGSLGEAYRLRGNYQQAANYAEQSLTAAKLLDNPQLTMSALNSLGNTYSSLAQVSYRRAESAEKRGETFGENSLLARETKTAQARDQKALSYFQQSLELAITESNSLAQVRSIINTLPIYYHLQQYERAATSKQKALSLIPTLPPEQTTVYATIDLAKLLQPERATFRNCLNADNLRQAQALLKPAVTLATRLGDKRAEAFALGELGHIYECQGNYQQALNLTQQARLAAEKDKDSLYLWEWQTGRILLAQGNKDQSIDAYETAIATLESIRDDLLTANRDIQFDFRDTVEPIYRELIEQRLETGDETIVIKANQTARVKNVSSVLNTVDSLRLAELQNYFGNDCAIADVITTDKVDLLQPDRHTAYFSSIILKDRIAIIVNFPNRQTKIAWHRNSGKTTITEEINRFRRGLEAFYDEDYDLQPGQNIYNWLIKPFAKDLQQAGIDTLVFTQDGILRSISMAALHDGKQFLVEKYALATTPSLNLIARSQVNPQKLKALALGLTQESTIEGRTYNSLPNVKREIKQVEGIFAESTGLLDKAFTRDRLQQELAKTSYPIVHIATHGQFSAEPEDTFLITGDGKKLTITELDRLIRTTAKDNQPINLISLTACQTAVGDERAALGLAGVAIQAGASSALASLWSISDEITPQVVKEFYTDLQQGNTTKAKALQQAQKSLIKRGEHPAFWSPFIIIGDWL